MSIGRRRGQEARRWRVRVTEHRVKDAPLTEDKQTLMPEDRQRIARSAVFRLVGVGEADKVEDEGINDLVRQCVLFVQQDSDKQ